MPRAKPVPISHGLLISCMGHVELGIVWKTHGGLWVRKQGHKQIRCDREMREILARGWAFEESALSETGQTLTMARPTVDGLAARVAHNAWRADERIVDTSIVERTTNGS